MTEKIEEIKKMVIEADNLATKISELIKNLSKEETLVFTQWFMTESQSAKNNVIGRIRSGEMMQKIRDVDEAYTDLVEGKYE